jgi:hypothetical protein
VQQPQQQHTASYYQAPGGGVQASPLYPTTSLNGSIAAPPVLNGMAMSMNGLSMNGVGLNGLGGQLQQQTSPLIGYSNSQLNGNTAPSVPGMMQPPSPNSVVLNNQHIFASAQQQQLAQQQQQPQTPSVNQQQQFLQQQQQQQQLNMLNGGMGVGTAGTMGMMPNMFSGMPMSLPFGFPQMAFQQVRDPEAFLESSGLAY